MTPAVGNQPGLLTVTWGSLAETRTAGQALGRALPRDAIVLLYGDMGSGKTTLAKDICEGLGIDPRQVISPTYTLVNVYPGAVSVYHVDLYRLETPDALLDMDRNDWIDPEGITLIEWPQAAEPLLAGESALTVSIAAAGARERREVTFSGDAERFGPVFAALARWRG